MQGFFKLSLSSVGEPSVEGIKVVTQKLIDYCQRNAWAGYDPYDALNSQIFQLLPFLNSRVPRLVLTQVLKRSPVNFRPLLLIPKTQNPKAIALFLMAFLKLSRLGLLDQDEVLIAEVIERLTTARSQGISYWCWGYSFPWQTRTKLVPRGAPNLVCTSFVGNALLDAYESRHASQYLSMAVSAADYILNDLYWTGDGDTACFAYPLPSSRTPVHNANLLGAALLCRVYQQTGQKKFLEPALAVARYSAAKQHEDGSWDYGESPTQRWVDNFHTGYNLCALQSICQYAGIAEFEAPMRRGYEFYRRHFFRDDGMPKYFHNRTYPIDIHSVAQSIITPLTLRELDNSSVELALSVYRWAMKHMWDEQGYFYYQTLPLYRNKISYIRWSQAWMLLALSSLLKEGDQERLA